MKEKKDEKLRPLSEEELENVTGGLFGGYADVSLPGYNCRYCGKIFSAEKECTAHEATCPQRTKTSFI